MISHHRLGETERRPSAGALPGRHLPLRHDLPGLPHAHATRQAGRGLRLREAAAPSHLAQPGLYGPAAAVRDGRAVQGMSLLLWWRKRGTLDIFATLALWALSDLRDVTNWNISGVSPANGSSQAAWTLHSENLRLCAWWELGACSSSHFDLRLWYFARAVSLPKLFLLCSNHCDFFIFTIRQPHCINTIQLLHHFLSCCWRLT